MKSKAAVIILSTYAVGISLFWARSVTNSYEHPCKIIIYGPKDFVHIGDDCNDTWVAFTDSAYDYKRGSVPEFDTAQRLERSPSMIEKFWIIFVRTNKIQVK